MTPNPIQRHPYDRFALPGWLMIPLCVVGVLVGIALIIVFSPLLILVGIPFAGIMLHRDNKRNRDLAAWHERRMNLEAQIASIESTIRYRGDSYSLNWQLCALRNALHTTNRKIEKYAA